jgi:hypothetical protein
LYFKNKNLHIYLFFIAFLIVVMWINHYFDELFNSNYVYFDGIVSFSLVYYYFLFFFINLRRSYNLYNLKLCFLAALSILLQHFWIYIFYDGISILIFVYPFVLMMFCVPCLFWLIIYGESVY